MMNKTLILSMLVVSATTGLGLSLVFGYIGLYFLFKG